MSTEGNQKLYEEYLAILEEYSESGSPEMHDYVRANQGWKIHLNVLPVNVLEVSRYLVKGGFSHKFISGANLDKGKVFTVFLGSKALTEKLVREVQDNIGSLLEPPIATGGILVSPKITARFGLYHHPDYIDQGYSAGIPLRKYYDENDLSGSVEISRKMLQSDFGDYFGGGIEYYDPNPSSL